ncbi:hypothetical protein P4129_08025 [Pseudomonas aeruginosa]|nr:hypothetical protein [Pseudomonas aeruginosa]
MYLEEGKLVGYYTLATSSVQLADIPADEAKGLPKYPLPAVLLSRLAVDGPARGKGLGKRLMAHLRNLEACRRCVPRCRCQRRQSCVVLRGQTWLCPLRRQTAAPGVACDRFLSCPEGSRERGQQSRLTPETLDAPGSLHTSSSGLALARPAASC